MTFGVNVTLRHPRKIRIGDDVAVDDGCVLDAKGAANDGIRIGRRVFLGRNTILACKEGDIVLEDGVNISYQCAVFSASSVRIGADTLLAAYCYVVGGGHEFDRTDVPVIRQGRPSKGVDVGRGAWLGAGAVVLDGVSVGPRRRRRRPRGRHPGRAAVRRRRRITGASDPRPPDRRMNRAWCGRGGLRRGRGAGGRRSPD